MIQFCETCKDMYIIDAYTGEIIEPCKCEEEK